MRHEECVCRCRDGAQADPDADGMCLECWAAWQARRLRPASGPWTAVESNGSRTTVTFTDPIANRARTLAILASVPEKLFQGQVFSQAKAWDWHGYHDTVAYRSDSGWPDNVFVRPGRLVVAELKKVGGKLSPKQREWLMWWWESGRCEGPYVWDPTCWKQIARVLAPEGVEVLD